MHVFNHGLALHQCRTASVTILLKKGTPGSHTSTIKRGTHVLLWTARLTTEAQRELSELLKYPHKIRHPIFQHSLLFKFFVGWLASWSNTHRRMERAGGCKGNAASPIKRCHERYKNSQLAFLECSNIYFFYVLQARDTLTLLTILCSACFVHFYNMYGIKKHCT